MWAAASNRDGPRGPQKIAQVQLDGLVLLKIIKHCKENFPEHVAGSLLGLDVEDTLQVTHRSDALRV
jgi:translation initiation factor 3 subunit H